MSFLSFVRETNRPKQCSEGVPAAGSVIMGLEPRERIANNRSNYQDYTLDVLVLETMTPRARLRSS
jgi:hypothetical protein